MLDRRMRGGAPALTAAVLILSACGAPGQEESRPAGPLVAADAPAQPWFREVSRARGLDFRHRTGHKGERFLIPEPFIGGVAFFDMESDGDLDVYLIQSGSLTEASDRRPGNQLYENLGDGGFRDITAGSGADDEGYGMGVACGDYDNDGDTDLYVTNVGPNVLLRNEGEGRFADVTEAARVGDAEWGTSSGFFDYDRDGDLDLYVANYVDWSLETDIQCKNMIDEDDYCGPLVYQPERDVLYRNEGDGTFTDVTVEAGLSAGYGNGLGVLFGDFTGDGWLDVFVANDLTPDQLWVNQRDGTFIDEAMVAGCAVGEAGESKAGMGTTAADIDNDGDLDVMVCNFAEETDSFFLNDGGTFTDVTNQAGLGVVNRPFTRFGMGWVDFDNDGFLDLYQANGRVKRGTRFAAGLYGEPNLLFRGLPGPAFEEVIPRGGTASRLIGASRGAAFGDFNNDGGQDILVGNRDKSVYLLQNIIHGEGGWIMFRALEEHGRDAEGSTIEVRIGERKVRRDVRTAFSYLACNDPRVHFGLGEAERVDDVTVRWLGGTAESFGPFEAGQVVTLREGGAPQF